MRRFIALVLFTSTFILCSVANAYAHKLPADVRVEYAIKAPADLVTFISYDRPETPATRIEVNDTVLDGAVTTPEANCNSPGDSRLESNLRSITHYLFNYGLRSRRDIK